MMKLAIRVLPGFLIQFFRMMKSKFNSSLFKGKTTRQMFTQIYDTNQWEGAESISGTGSDQVQTQKVIGIVDRVIAEYKPKNMLDIPCGDFNWMQNVDLSSVQYMGGDIVEPLIENNKKRFENEARSFKVLDLIRDELGEHDLIFCRDCLVHLAYEDVFKALSNIKKSGSKYLLTTTFPGHSFNYNIATGQWRTLNLQKGPFRFPKPLKVFNEHCTEGYGEFKDKSLALWKIEDIPDFG